MTGNPCKAVNFGLLLAGNLQSTNTGGTMKQAYGAEYKHGSNMKNGTVIIYAFRNVTVRNHWVTNSRDVDDQ